MFANGPIISKGIYEKLFINSFLLVTSLALLGFSAFGQDKTEDHQKTVEAAYQKLAGVSYRLKSLKRISNGFSGVETKATAEFVAPDQSKVLKTTDYWTDDDGEPQKPDKIQIITTGKKSYVKIDAENWKEISETELAKLPNSIDDYFSLKNLTYPVKDLVIKAAGQENANGQKLDIYKANYSADKRIYEVGYWISADGFLIKTEYKVNYKGWTIKLTETYEYGANIKIEVPKLN